VRLQLPELPEVARVAPVGQEQLRAEPQSQLLPTVQELRLP